MEDKLLTPDQVSQILQIHPFTVLKFIKQGKLVASKIGRVYRIRQSDLEYFLDQSAGRSSKTTQNQSASDSKIKTKINSPENSSPEKNALEKQTQTTEIKIEKIQQINQEVVSTQPGDEHFYILD